MTEPRPPQLVRTGSDVSTVALSAQRGRAGARDGRPRLALDPREGQYLP
jgi:hypothetical protein